VGVDLKLVSVADADHQGALLEWTPLGFRPRSGDRVAFQIENHGQHPIDVTLLHISQDYGITAFFPAAGRIVNNTVSSEEIYRTSPVEFTYDGPGWEHMLLLAVQSEGPPLDFTYLEQNSFQQMVRGVSRAGPLDELLSRVAYGEEGRRGLDAPARANYGMTKISWRVAPAD
jgi:hypothetical protein